MTGLTYDFEIDGEPTTGTLRQLADAIRRKIYGECVHVAHPFYVSVTAGEYDENDYAPLTVTDTTNGDSVTLSIDGRA